MKKDSQKNSTPNPSENTGVDGKKNRPTPKRKDAQKRNLRPLVADSKKERRAKSKQQRDLALQRQRDALDGRGDPRYLPDRDKGPVRKYARDRIDSRWTISEFLLPLMLLALLPSFFLNQNSIYSYIPVTIIYVLLIISIGEMIFITRSVRSNLKPHYSADKMKGLGMYIMGRMLSPRRFRSPVATVKRGETIPIP